MNKTAASEWIVKVWHDLSSAQILYNANHYTDSIGVDLHYAIEKSFKAMIAYKNKKIPKTHDLDKLYNLVKNGLEINQEELELLDIATEYHIQEAYPHYARPLPPREEIKEVLDFTLNLFNRVCNILNIDQNEVTK